MPPNVSILTTGGTIASTAGNEGAEPDRRGEELLDSVPAIGDHADLSVTQVVQRPSFDMDTETMATLVREARTAVSDGSDGVVITHGTDTMEESAYYLDLVLDLNAPIVFTGAQRRPDEVSPDGPANLLASVRVVTDDQFQEQGGVYIVMDDEVHAARDVTKMHTAALDTFHSPDKGPVGVLTRETVRTYREPGSRSIDLSVMESEKRVPMVKSAAGIDGTAFERVVGSDADGVVVEGTGLGNTTAALGEKIETATQGARLLSSRLVAPPARRSPCTGRPAVARRWQTTGRSSVTTSPLTKRD
jgi:L-asparaginase